MTQEEINGWSDLRQEVNETRRLLMTLDQHIRAKSPDERMISILQTRVTLVPSEASAGR